MKKDIGVSITIGYILIETNPEQEHEVYNSLSHESRIMELKPIFYDHDYDLMAKIKSKNQDTLRSFVFKKIQPLNGVIDAEILC